MDELDPEGLRELKDRDVFDVNGQRLGRVSGSFAQEGAVVRFDVTLSDNAKGIFDAAEDVVGVPPAWVGRIGEDGIHLRKAAQDLVEPALNPEDAKVGAKELPRKER